jgi:hypothetical protein
MQAEAMLSEERNGKEAMFNFGGLNHRLARAQ